MKYAVLLLPCVFLFCFSVVAQMQIIEIEKPLHAKSIAGVVNDPSGAALQGVRVEECSADWKAVLRSTNTDDKGRFHFSRASDKITYFLQFTLSGFDWVRIKLQLDKKAAPTVKVRMPVGT